MLPPESPVPRRQRVQTQPELPASRRVVRPPSDARRRASEELLGSEPDRTSYEPPHVPPSSLGEWSSEPVPDTLSLPSVVIAANDPERADTPTLPPSRRAPRRRIRAAGLVLICAATLLVVAFSLVGP